MTLDAAVSAVKEWMIYTVIYIWWGVIRQESL